MNSKKSLMLSVIGVLGLIAITIGVSFAFFNYAKEGTTDNTITTGTITFLYTEVSGVGKGISLIDSYPISDNQGKNLTGEGKVFDFKVTSTNNMNASIPYEITARKKDGSTLDEGAVKIYLTKVSGDSEEEVLLDNYSNLSQTDKVSSTKYNEKTLYTSKVPASIGEYEQAYRLRMWIDESTDFSPVEDSSGNITYPYNDKEFTVTINVYANAKVVTEEDIENASKAEISNISIDGTELTKVENQNYDYEISLPEGTTQATLNIETTSEYATIKVERIDSLAYSSNIKRLSTKKVVDLNPGDNYFKVTVTSEDGKVDKEYKINLKVLYTVELEGFAKIIYDNNKLVTTTPDLSKSFNNTNDESGLYVSTDTNFNGFEGLPTYYFRGNVENNYVDFAGYTWRVVRINEDGTIRLIMQNGINDNTMYAFNSFRYSNIDYTYYSNSNVKEILEEWYYNEITNNNLHQYVSIGNYYCEQARVRLNEDYGVIGNTYWELGNKYIPDFTCRFDGHDKGIVSSYIGLISYDEVTYAGGYINSINKDFYLYNNNYFWFISPAAATTSYTYAYAIANDGLFTPRRIYYESTLRPVINLKPNVTVTGTGKSDDHWIVQ